MAYGADAVYIGYPGLSLRDHADFKTDEIEEAIKYSRQKNSKLYIALNIFAYNQDLEKIKKAIRHLKTLDVDGLIVSDPGIIQLIKENWNSAKLHLSTQSNTLNAEAVKFWKNIGINRICLARETSLEDIKEICQQKLLDIEIFIHGAMCISYSGRCLLSKYMTGREANKGDCAHSCRWNYYLEEELRPGEYLNIFEDNHGTYIMNSKDLCLARKIPQLIDAGVDAFKIEGRMKSVYYVAVVTSVYRQIIDAYYNEGKDFVFRDSWIENLESISHRPYTEGFVADEQQKEYEKSSKVTQTHKFVGVVKDCRKISNGNYEYRIAVRNQIKSADNIEFFTPSGKIFSQKIGKMVDYSSNEIKDEFNPNSTLFATGTNFLPEFTIVRKIVNFDNSD